MITLETIIARQDAIEAKLSKLIELVSGMSGGGTTPSHVLTPLPMSTVVSKLNLLARVDPDAARQQLRDLAAQDTRQRRQAKKAKAGARA